MVYWMNDVALAAHGTKLGQQQQLQYSPPEKYCDYILLSIDQTFQKVGKYLKWTLVNVGLIVDIVYTN